MKRIIFIAVGLAFVLGWGCREKPTLFVEEGTLSFSVDTVYFDSIFTNFASPTERVTVINNSGNNVRISRISFQNGQEFGLIFDGLTANEIVDYELADGDSAVAFINFQSETKDQFLRDKLLFQVGNQVQDVDIEAFVFDGVWLSDTTLTPANGANNTIWDPALKYIVDGPVVVPDGVTLIIPAGTQVYFTPRKDQQFNLISTLVVYGSLRAYGDKGNEVVFQQTRFGRRYEETPGQWRGLAFANISNGNEIRHAIIKNGLIGIYQEYGNDGIFSKILLERTEIRNMAAYGILTAGYTTQLDPYPTITANNCLVHNCSEGTLRIIGGGFYRFNHCTFANYTVDFTRNSPQMIVNNYDAADQVITELPLRATFRNCIVWGSEEEEILKDTLPGSNFELEYDHCMVRTTLPVAGSIIGSTTDPDANYPRFVDPTAAEPDERDYRIESGSPARDQGRTLSGLGVDLDNLPRDADPDLGAYEYRE